MALDDSLKSGSTAVRLWRQVQTVGSQWAETSTSLAIARQLGVTDSTAASTHQSESDHGTTGEEEMAGEEEMIGEAETTDETERSGETETETEPFGETEAVPGGSDTPGTPSSGLYGSALSYRLWVGVRRFVESSWLYRWLTAEPDAEVVVIDLRETLSAGPVLASVDQAIRNAIEVMPTSGGLRRGYRLRQGVRDHPIRIASFGAIGAILVGFVGVVVAGGPLGVGTFVLIVGLLVAARGTQNRTPLSEITATGWYQLLAETFEPPAPPADRPSESSRDTLESTESAVDDRDEPSR